MNDQLKQCCLIINQNIAFGLIKLHNQAVVNDTDSNLGPGIAGMPRPSASFLLYSTEINNRSKVQMMQVID